MSVKIRPINASDKKRFTPSETQIIKSAPAIRLDKAHSTAHTVVSSSIFGDVKRLDDEDFQDKLYEDRFTRVGRIDLIKPVLNPFLAGRTAPIWRMVLGLGQDEIISIINANTMLDVETGNMIKVTDKSSMVYNSERYLFGAECLLYLLDRVDLKKELLKAVYKEFIVRFLTTDEKKAFEQGFYTESCVREMTEDELALVLTEGVNGWLFGNLKLELSPNEFSENRITEIYEDIWDVVYSEGSLINIAKLQQYPAVSVFSVLMEKGIDVLKEQVLNFIFVLPYGFRPTIDNRVDPLTSQYNKLENVNTELEDVLNQRDASCYTVLNKYRELVSYLRNIFVGDKMIQKVQRLDNYKSISDTITGKKGLMRDRMQGARIDYSARSVIICDPEMPVDCIGIPKKILEKVAEPAIIKYLKKTKKAEGTGKRLYVNRNMSTFSTSSRAKEKFGISYEEALEEYFGVKPRYGIVGRQPTLFYLGMQAFKIIPVDGNAIMLSPLVVEPFNADFDGDTMHFNMPITEAGEREVRVKMASVNNLRYPKNGEITIKPRHEIIYGLWVISQHKSEEENSKVITKAIIDALRTEYNLNDSASAGEVIYEAVCKQDINIYDRVDSAIGQTSAGMRALEFAVFHSTYVDPAVLKDFYEMKIKAKPLIKVISNHFKVGSDAFLRAIDRIVKLGFGVASIYPPNISTIISQDIRDAVNAMIEEFIENTIKREDLVNKGIEIESEYTTYFNNAWAELKDNVLKYLLSHLDLDNGYIAMKDSGGKGDNNNILQIFGLKGRVQKTDITAFNSIISGCYASGLTGLEGFVAAYGSRKGISDKVLATAEPGYLSRKLEHAGANVIITADDCKTLSGMNFTIGDIVPFLEEPQISRYGVIDDVEPTDKSEIYWSREENKTQLLAATDYLATILTGRYVNVFDKEGNYEDTIYLSTFADATRHIGDCWGTISKETKKYIYPKKASSIVLRSPVYCNKPCCKVCYGRDIAAGKESSDIGRAVGFVAAQAIGEPGTQMTMKNFQKGGVVTEANLTSSFELIEDYFELHDFSNKFKNSRGVISYDKISPVSGYVKEQYLGNGSKKILVTKTNNPTDRVNLIPETSKILVHAGVKLKEYVNKGDSFQKIQGNLNMREVLKYRGYDKAASYLSLMLYNIFISQDVNFKHFESIVAGMTVGCLMTNQSPSSTVDSAPIPYGKGSTFKAGTIVTRPEACYGIEPENMAIVWTLLGLKALPKFKNDFFESLLMENMDSYIPRAVLVNPNDSMSNPITRMAFGLNMGIGTDLEG